MSKKHKRITRKAKIQNSKLPVGVQCFDGIIDLATCMMRQARNPAACLGCRHMGERLA